MMATPRKDHQTGQMMTGNRNAGKKLENPTPGPWLKWRTKSRAARAIRFIETYCRSPKGYGAGKPLRLAGFQKVWLEEVLGDGVQAAVMSVGRGNGKSTFLASIGLWALFDPDESGAPQIPVVATTVQQAVTSVYGVALAMVRDEWELSSRCHVYSAIGAQKIVTPLNHGEMFPKSNDPDGLQGLDPSLGIVDEIGFMPVTSWDSMLLASGKRPRSLVVGIGTPGFEKDNALWHMRERVRHGDLPSQFRFTEFAADEGCAVGDRDQWLKANPALAEGYMNEGALEMAVAMSPESHFRIFRLGQWHEGVECWLGDDGKAVWDGLEDGYELVEGGPVWVGVDVALKHDSTAVVWVQQRDDGRWHAESKIWNPTEDGRLDVTDVMATIRQLGERFELREVSFDPRFFDLPAQQLLDEGYPMMEIPQSLQRMTPAVGATFEAIKRGEITHNADAAFTAHVLNAVPRMNETGFTLSKGKSRGKIDAAVALCIAYHRANSRPELPAVSELWAAFE
jgi:phage terminase large subunit-like protein